MKKYSLSLVVPVYNEELILEDFVVESIDNLKKVTDDFEIILVNDGSTDKTGDILKQLEHCNNCIKVINFDRNMGVGVATKVGLKAAIKEVVFNNTVDAFFDLKDLPKFLQYLDKYDVISGYRINLKSNNLYGKMLTLGNYFLIRFLFQLKLKAFQTVQFLKKDFLDNIEIESSTTFVAPEILIKAHRLGYKIKEIETEYRKRKAGRGKCGKLVNVFKSLHDILKFWFKWIVFNKRVTK